ncbi:uncharacterized protein K444DRAFT_612260 [Hyaloscypha bicolor E]|uniref:ABM domain-containing protein n=1 Tax=Hyaloscypha bicolor E TaxID=1095630 RepID=A0A2J6TDC7_9HELO|nr:uncharacterized protein K444DRAFT_612260 [Hyaloscypha bicolor E]PMD60992.1 hypothetical protein K444DRAFT_612260 [Hyaloscypha bicolor E]
MAFPITYPAVSGPGRLLEICSFRRSSIPESRYDEVFNGITAKTSQFPIARQTLSGRKASKEERDITVLIADWTSADEKDIFEPGPEYQGIKPAFGELVNAGNPTFACHHIILPGLGVTPEAGRYVAEFFSVSGLKQGEFAEKLREHVESLVGDTMPIFFHAAPSRENAEVVVAVSGWKSGVNAGAYMAGDFKKLQETTRPICTEVVIYQADMKKWEASQ